MERQRHLEWEKQRIHDLRTHLKKELDYVTLVREKTEKLDGEYQILVCTLISVRKKLHTFNFTVPL